MRRLHHDRVPARLGMLRDARVAGHDDVVGGGLPDVDRLADVADGDRVPPRRDRDQGIGGDDPPADRVVVIRGLAAHRRQGFAREAIDRALVGGAVSLSVILCL